MTERDETTRPLTNRLPKELLDDWRKAAIRSIPLSSAAVLALLDALDAREAQTCAFCQFYRPEAGGGYCERVQFYPPEVTFGCNQWAAKESGR